VDRRIASSLAEKTTVDQDALLQLSLPYRNSIKSNPNTFQITVLPQLPSRPNIGELSRECFVAKTRGFRSRSGKWVTFLAPSVHIRDTRIVEPNRTKLDGRKNWDSFVLIECGELTKGRTTINSKASLPSNDLATSCRRRRSGPSGQRMSPEGRRRQFCLRNCRISNEVGVLDFIHDLGAYAPLAGTLIINECFDTRLTCRGNCVLAWDVFYDASNQTPTRFDATRFPKTLDGCLLSL